jgi:hypothetical protein
MKARYITVGGILVLGLVSFIVFQTLFQENHDAEKMNYNTMKEPIESRFHNLPNFRECYWKADTIGNTNLGPTNYWLRGFICLDEKAFQDILSNYEWSIVSIVFPKGIEPVITGRSNFSWHFNKDFQITILRQNFVGSIFLDTTNGIIYFDVENN